MKELTLPQAKKLIYIMYGLFVAMIIMHTIVTNDFFGYQIYEEERSSNYELGKTVGIERTIMGIYPTPEALQQALDNGEIEWSMLTPSLQYLLENVDEVNYNYRPYGDFNSFEEWCYGTGGSLHSSGLCQTVGGEI